MQTVKTKYFEYGDKEVEYLINADQALGDTIRRLGHINREVISDLFAALICRNYWAANFSKNNLAEMLLLNSMERQDIVSFGDMALNEE